MTTIAKDKTEPMGDASDSPPAQKTLGAMLDEALALLQKTYNHASAGREAADAAKEAAEEAASSAKSAEESAEGCKSVIEDVDLSAASDAKDEAENAASNADEAKGAAEAAQSSADEAKDAAEAAQSSADEAKDAANAALERIEEVSKKLDVIAVVLEKITKLGSIPINVDVAPPAPPDVTVIREAIREAAVGLAADGYTAVMKFLGRAKS